jgi:hypothetical protein
MYNRLIGKTRKNCFESGILENREIIQVCPKQCECQTRRWKQIFTLYPIEFAKNINKGEIIELETKKGSSLGFHNN